MRAIVQNTASEEFACIAHKKVTKKFGAASAGSACGVNIQRVDAVAGANTHAKRYLDQRSNHGVFAVPSIGGTHKTLEHCEQRTLSAAELFEQKVRNGCRGELELLLHFVKIVLAIRVLRSEAGAKQSRERSLKHQAARP